MRLTVLDQASWQARRIAHEERVDTWVAPYLARRQRGEAHPVEDFMFTYYSFRPAQLRRWQPGATVVLAGADESIVDIDAFLAERGSTVSWIRRLLATTAQRPPHFGCFGLHEWAMVYRQPSDKVRHRDWPLRLPAADIAAVVDERGIRCSHFDAVRFFTPAARPLNVLNPTREEQHQHEQPGCLHTNMDLYKWAYKLSPLIASELIADCFALARRIRELDMRASPYDLADLGYPAVRIETAEGRAEYAVAQRVHAADAAKLRERLRAALAALDLGDASAAR